MYTLLPYKMSCDDELLKKIIQSKLQFLPWGAWRDELSFIDELIGFEFETFKSVSHPRDIPWGVINFAAFMNELGGSSAV